MGSREGLFVCRWKYQTMLNVDGNNPVQRETDAAGSGVLE